MPMSKNVLSRRRFLSLTGRASLALAIAPLDLLPPILGITITSVRSGNWDNPLTWGGIVPTAGYRAVVAHNVVVNKNVTAGGVTVNPSGILRWANKSATLTSTANVVVRGRLCMRPPDASVIHRLLFAGVDEKAFAGGGQDVLASDIGLWVMDAGRLELVGSPKLAWTRAASSVAQGASSIVVMDTPSGWRVGDDVAIAPTGSPSTNGHATAYDIATITGISGTTISLSRPTTFAHPAVTVAPGKTMTAEVMNLTRNARVEGTVGGRSHVFVRSTKSQIITGAAIHHVGPRQASADGYTAFVPGRYGLHFHLSGAGSVGSLVESVVIRDAGSHAFVAHESTGVIFRNCISHDTFEDPYWWDQAIGAGFVGPPTDDTTYDRCVASLVRCDPAFRGYGMSGFMLGAGTGNRAIGCVAVGVLGNATASGFQWPEGSIGVWQFEDCVSHNNNVHGIYAWQNGEEVHVISRFVAYHNGGAGIAQGAYVTRYRYDNSVFYANALAGLELHASSLPTPELAFSNTVFDGGGLSDHGVITTSHVLDGGGPTGFYNCTFRGHRVAGVGFWGDGGAKEVADFVGCTFEGNEFWLASTVPATSIVRVQDAVRGTISVQRADQPGTLRPQWNGRIKPLAAFA